MLSKWLEDAYRNIDTTREPKNKLGNECKKE